MPLAHPQAPRTKERTHSPRTYYAQRNEPNGPCILNPRCTERTHASGVSPYVFQNGTNPLHLAYPQPIKFFGTNPFLWCIHTHPAQRNEPNTICLQPDLHGTNPFAPRSRSHNHSAGTNPIIWPYPPPTLNDQERTQLSSLFHAHTHHEQERTHFPGTSLSTTLLNSLDQERTHFINSLYLLCHLSPTAKIRNEPIPSAHLIPPPSPCIYKIRNEPNMPPYPLPSCLHTPFCWNEPNGLPYPCPPHDISPIPRLRTGARLCALLPPTTSLSPQAPSQPPFLSRSPFLRTASYWRKALRPWSRPRSFPSDIPTPFVLAPDLPTTLTPSPTL